MPGSVSRHFLGWKLPLVQTVREWLTSGWSGTGVLNLSDCLVVVPSRTAGRRLREALAVHAAESGAAVFPPLVVTPDYLIAPARLAIGSPVASGTQELLIWTALLQRIRLHEVRRLFPVDPVDRSLLWAHDTAGNLLAVRRLLVEAGHTFSSAAGVMAEQGLEAGRWFDLAVLEKAAGLLFGERGIEDPGMVQLRLPEEMAVPADIRRIVVAGLADLRTLAGAVLTRLSAEVPVDLLIAAPEAAADTFDLWGRPLAAGWARREIPLPEASTSLRRLNSPREQGEWVVDRCTAWSGETATVSREGLSSIVAIGIPDAELGPELAQTCRQAGLGTYDPAGEPLAGTGLAYLLQCTGDALVSGSFAAFRRFLICPGAARAMLRSGVTEGEPSFSETSLLGDADRLDRESMPTSLGDALSALPRLGAPSALGVGLRWLQRWQDRFRKEAFVPSVVAFLAELHEGRSYTKRDPQGQALAAAADALVGLAEDFRALGEIWPKPLPLAEHFELLQRRLASEVLYPEHEVGDLELCGWLELPWEDTPRLILTGMNDHAVPESTVGHAYLPDSARKVLGIPHNEDRFARDAYFLTFMIESRRGLGGWVELLFGSHSLSGNPLRPSRLLFQCPIEDLPKRTQRLFQGTAASVASPAREQGFRLLPEALPADHRARTKLSASAMRTYLLCPFRYYLKQGLRMESVTPSQGELEARDFGTILHDTLEALATAREATATIPAKITAFFHAELDRQIERRYGARLPVPLVIQREAARNRLRWWAEIEAAQRREGWQILETEVAFGSETWPFEIDDMVIRGRIDRIEEHPEHGIRVIDFKTGNYKGKRHVAADSHLNALKKSESPDDFEPWSLHEDESGKIWRWTDLQLPLYLLAVAPKHPDRAITTAYVTLGQTEPEISLELWPELAGPCLESARACARGIVGAVRAGIFWPARELNTSWDDFAEILAPDAATAVDPRHLLAAESARS